MRSGLAFACLAATLAACGPVRSPSPLGPAARTALIPSSADDPEPLAPGAKLRCRMSAALNDQCAPSGFVLTPGNVGEPSPRRVGFVLPAAPGHPAGEGVRSFRALSVRRSLTPQTALALSAGSGPHPDAPDVRVTLGFQYSF
jgi:hypothetical protein